MAEDVAKGVTLWLPGTLGAKLSAAEEAFVALLTTEDGVSRVAAIRAEPRDRAIIYARVYHHLSTALQEQVPGPDWCAFAKWSSRQVSEMFDLRTNGPFVGSAIRRMGLRFAAGPVGAMFRRLLGGPEYVTSLRLANEVIFAEMATLHARLLAHYRRDPAATPDAPRIVEGALAQAQQIFARLGIAAEQSQLGVADKSLLIDAVAYYHRARETEGTVASAEYLLGACACLSAYEQARAQGALEQALYRPARLLLVVWWKKLWWSACNVFRRQRRPLRQYVQSTYRGRHKDQPLPVRWSETKLVVFLTSRVLQISTPVKSLVLGKPIGVPSEAGGKHVARLSVPEVVDLVGRFGVEPGFTPTVHSKNWLNYPDRMRFIITYFRVYQHVPQMITDPYQDARWLKRRRWLNDEVLLGLYQSATDPDPAEGVLVLPPEPVGAETTSTP